MLLEKWEKDKARRTAKPSADKTPVRLISVNLGPNDLLLTRPAKYPTPEEAAKLMRDIKRLRAKMTGKGIKETGSDVLRKLRDGRLK